MLSISRKRVQNKVKQQLKKWRCVVVVFHDGGTTIRFFINNPRLQAVTNKLRAAFDSKNSKCIELEKIVRKVRSIVCAAECPPGCVLLSAWLPIM